MSEENKIDVKYLQAFVLRETENDQIQKLDSNFYNLISKFIENSVDFILNPDLI